MIVMRIITKMFRRNKNNELINSPSTAYHLPTTNFGRQTLNLSKGFTIVELLVVIAVIAIIATLTVVAYNDVQKDAATVVLKSDLDNASAQLTSDNIKNGSYPTSIELANYGKGLSQSEGTVFSYYHTATGYCLSATSTKSGNSIFHISSTEGSIKTGDCPLTYLMATLVATTASTSSIDLSWDSVVGAASYTLQQDDNSSFTHPTNIVTQSGTTFTAINLSPATTYYYRFNATIAGDTSDWSSMASAATTVEAPSAPTVSYNTVSTTTTWSWTTPSCPVGTTARYQYKYTITPAGYDSGWVAIASSPVAFTTSVSMETYTVEVQAQCYNTNVTSGWSISGSVAYYRSTQVLTTIAEIGGTVSAGGTYTSGSTQTITATPSANYTFASWTGNTGCSGVASHTITMDEDKTCTANFTYTADVLYFLKTLAAGNATIATKYANIDIEMVVLVGNQVISANTSWGNATADTRMLGVRVEGNLTVNAGVTLTTAARKRGMAIYVTGDTTINGTISMTDRGANAVGQQVLLLNNGTEYQVAAAGGAGGVDLVTADNTGVAGGAATSTGACGGGGSGAGHYDAPYIGRGGTGSAGTSYSGGSGGGGRRNDVDSPGNPGIANGGAGGAAIRNPTGWGASGGAGNPGGAGDGVAAGQSGTGGLLVLFVKGSLTIDTNGAIVAKGNTTGNGGGGTSGGGGSGGGSVNVFYSNNISAGAETKLSAVGTADTFNGNPGGIGGTGTTRLVQNVGN